MTALPRRQYRDPLDVVLEQEAETCKGCMYRQVRTDGTKAYCNNPDVKSLQAEKRCDRYEDGPQ